MYKVFSIIAVCLLLGALSAPQTTYAASYTTDSIASRIAVLMAELQKIQAQLAQLRSEPTYAPNTNYQNCYPAQGGYYCTVTQTRGYQDVWNTDGVRSIAVDFNDGVADITIRYDRGSRDEFSVDADNREEAIDFIIDETNLSESVVRSLATFTGTPGRHSYSHYNDDVDSIDVTIDRDDDSARARVRYEDGTRDTFDYDTDVKREIISELSDDLDMDEDDVEDVVDWSYDDSNSNHNDLDSISIDIRNNKAYARVEFDNGTIRNYTYYTDDEDEIISELSDDLDIDESDLEDFIDWE
jgi:hypothetical protein